MKIAIISDIHENFHNLLLALQEMQKHHIEQILCLGDLMNCGVAKILAAQEIPVHMIWGNNDGEVVEIVLTAKAENSSLTVGLNTYDFLEFDGRKIFISHYDDLSLPMAKSGTFDAVFFGHSHISSSEYIDNCLLVNPGEIAAAKTGKATFAIYNTKDNTAEIISLAEPVSLKTPLVVAYFKEHAHKMGLRQGKITELLTSSHKEGIPTTSPVYKALEQMAKTARVVALSGLPGVGKSLYARQFKIIAQVLGKNLTVIQWDIARKAFETSEIFARFPMGEGVVHNGVKLSVGRWLMDTLKEWLAKHHEEKDLLLIEAPLVGHRFVELAQVQADEELEAFLKSEAFQFIMPIPSKQVRAKIEADRRAQIAEDAKTWTGAKPSVLLQLWKMICGIANEFGKNILLEQQPPYDPEVYEFVFSKILKHRHFVPLHIDEIFSVSVTDEKELHNLDSLKADADTANRYAQEVADQYPDHKDIDAIVKRWYLNFGSSP